MGYIIVSTSSISMVLEVLPQNKPLLNSKCSTFIEHFFTTKIKICVHE